jgi:crotonobetainyl-CoA:carnitine CoA-transferase CaiB-like acyl-CoA transferase
MTSSALPFAGLKVIDCASYIAAPIAATVLADFGADVIKIEAPGDGDPWHTAYSRLPQQNGVNFPWLLDNRNKRGLAIDLKAPAGRAVLERLVSQADVFITNLPLPVRERLKVRYSDFDAHPRLIYGSLTAYGEVGEEAGKTGFDVTAYWARGGLMDHVRADHTTVPGRAIAGMGDHPTGIALYAGITTALYQREKTGRGSEVRSSLLANGMWASSFLVQAQLCGVEIPVRGPREEMPRALSNMYQTSDGRWFLLALTSEIRQWPALARAIGRADLITDPRFAEDSGRSANVRALTEIFDATFAAQPLGHWRATLDAAGLTFGIVGTVPEIAADPQALAAGILRPLADTGMMTIDSPFTLTETPKAPITLAPDQGGHNAEILLEAGYSAGEIAALLADKVIQGS